jgi:hypothetical protein
MSTQSPNRYKHYRFPVEIISHGVWLYYRFCLSYRDVEELLFARGIIVTYEAIRKWCRKFGQQYAHQLRRRLLDPRPGLGTVRAVARACPRFVILPCRLPSQLPNSHAPPPPPRITVISTGWYGLSCSRKSHTFTLTVVNILVCGCTT